MQSIASDIVPGQKRPAASAVAQRAKTVIQMDRMPL